MIQFVWDLEDDLQRTRNQLQPLQHGAELTNVAYQTAAQENEGQIYEWLWGYMTESRAGTASPFWVRYNPYNGVMMQNITNVPRDVTSIKIENNSPIVWI